MPRYQSSQGELSIKDYFNLYTKSLFIFDPFPPAHIQLYCAMINNISEYKMG